MIDIIQVFQDAADHYGYSFAYGRQDILNYESGNIDVSAGQTILFVFPFIEDGVISNSLINRWAVHTQLWIGKKFDIDFTTGTFSNLDETELQKYDRRLKDLRDTMNTFIAYVFCNNTDLELTRARIFREINQTDENIDFVTADISFLYDN